MLVLCIDVWHLHTSELAGNGEDLATQVLVVTDVSKDSIADHCCTVRPMSVASSQQIKVMNRGC